MISNLKVLNKKQLLVISLFFIGLLIGLWLSPNNHDVYAAKLVLETAKHFAKDYAQLEFSEYLDREYVSKILEKYDVPQPPRPPVQIAKITVANITSEDWFGENKTHVAKMHQAQFEKLNNLVDPSTSNTMSKFLAAKMRDAHHTKNLTKMRYSGKDFVGKYTPYWNTIKTSINHSLRKK